MSPPPSHIQTYVWEIVEDGRIAVVQHGQQHHVLVACDTYNSLSDALVRVAELERQFAAQQRAESSAPLPPVSRRAGRVALGEGPGVRVNPEVRD